jgi:hypothetical protein
VPQGVAPDPTGVALKQLYSDNRFHNIGTPYNPGIPGVAKGDVTGLQAHRSGVLPIPVTPPLTFEGFFRTPTLRNVAKGATADFTKAYAHNGYFKSVEDIVHFYNTRDAKPGCSAVIPAIENPTAAQALANDCWPAPEFPATAAGAPIIGNLGLTCGGRSPFCGTGGPNADEEAALVAYIKALTDLETPEPPK